MADSYQLAETLEAVTRRVDATVTSLLISFVENKAEGVRRRAFLLVQVALYCEITHEQAEFPRKVYQEFLFCVFDFEVVSCLAPLRVPA